MSSCESKHVSAWPGLATRMSKLATGERREMHFIKDRWAVGQISTDHFSYRNPLQNIFVFLLMVVVTEVFKAVKINMCISALSDRDSWSQKSICFFLENSCSSTFLLLLVQTAGLHYSSCKAGMSNPFHSMGHIQPTLILKWVRPFRFNFT